MSDQDKNLSTALSGPALELASRHTTSQQLKLYGSWFCPFVQRAWITLEEKKAQYQYHEINPYHKAPEFLALNPRGLVPTLEVVGKRPLYESIVVCEYLDEAAADGDAEGRLLPEDAYDRARCRLWIDHIATKIIPGWYKVMQHTSDKAFAIEEARAEFHKHIEALVKEMVDISSGPFFLGEKISLVDIALAPWAKRLFLLDYYKNGGHGLPNSSWSSDVKERWDAWYKAILQRKSVKDTCSDDARYIEAYKRYADDTTQSEVGQATRAGTRLP